MGKFNSYAKMLDEAFREARDSYATVAGKLEAAKKEQRLANTWFAETYVGERESRRARAKADLIVAQDNFRTESKRIWSEFDAKAIKIRSEFMAALKAHNLANPDAIDNAGLELMKSGALTAEDMESLADRYDSNPTMLKMLSKYAAEAAEKSGDKAESSKFQMVHAATKDGYSRVVRQFDTLSEIARKCSGRSSLHDKTNSDPDYTVSVGKHWESLTSETVANF